MMWHRHLNHTDWTLAAVDDVIARGRMEDWKALRDAQANDADIRARIIQVCQPRLSDPYAQRYHFWNAYVRRTMA
jgi:hypothetical protein